MSVWKKVQHFLSLIKRSDWKHSNPRIIRSSVVKHRLKIIFTLRFSFFTFSFQVKLKGKNWWCVLIIRICNHKLFITHKIHILSVFTSLIILISAWVIRGLKILVKGRIWEMIETLKYLRFQLKKFTNRNDMLYYIVWFGG